MNRLHCWAKEQRLKENRYLFTTMKFVVAIANETLLPPGEG